MIILRRAVAVMLLVLVVARLTPPAVACGPSSIEPIFVFRESPDLPFTDYLNGNIGIVLPTFGRKTLVIAYRYLNGFPFTVDEQKELIPALKGQPPANGKSEPVKQWIAARKEVIGKDEPTPDIYLERQYGGYDFFPNCAGNAFEVAIETLRDRAARYETKDVLDWLAAQDTVFKNCANGSHLPAEVGMDRPEWLRKDRDYQRAAALFYSLRLDEARTGFAAIAEDANSPWQETADYLVVRTITRQASLIKDETRKRQLYEEAELKALPIESNRGRFSEASRRLLGLVKYRLRPEERVRELARSLTFENGNANVRQDLIDYVWLLDKFENMALEEKLKRERDPDYEERQRWRNVAPARQEAVDQDDQIAVTLYVRKEHLSPGQTLYFKPDVSDSEVRNTFETHLGRPITTEESKELVERRQFAVENRNWSLSPNRQLHFNDHEGGERGKLPRELMPELLIADDLGDWILTVQAEDPRVYDHAFKRWRETGSHAWLLAALMKAEKHSPGLSRLLRAAQTVDRSLPAFAGSLYHTVRLTLETGKKSEARALLDGLPKADLERLPVSSQNLFAEQRLHLAEDLSVFLRSGLQTPVAFYDDGRLGPLLNLLEAKKEHWDPQFHEEDKSEFEKSVEEEFQERMKWNGRVLLDFKTTEILNTHFPLPSLVEVSRSPVVPDYLRLRIALAVFTRAVVLQKPGVADQIVADILKLEPGKKTFLAPYLGAKTVKEKDRAALFMMLKNPSLSPLIADGLAESQLVDYGPDHYYELAWWCPPSLTEYNAKFEQVPKQVPKPQFLTAAQVAEAKKEHTRLIEIGDAKSYLGKRVLEWARAEPDDPRIPEALFIAVRANVAYKYGCEGWTHDKKTLEEAEKMLRGRYPNNAWTMKLKNNNN